jgi:hypothetical protein
MVSRGEQHADGPASSCSAEYTKAVPFAGVGPSCCRYNPHLGVRLSRAPQWPLQPVSQRAQPTHHSLHQFCRIPASRELGRDQAAAAGHAGGLHHIGRGSCPPGQRALSPLLKWLLVRPFSSHLLHALEQRDCAPVNMSWYVRIIYARADDAPAMRPDMLKAVVAAGREALLEAEHR